MEYILTESFLTPPSILPHGTDRRPDTTEVNGNGTEVSLGGYEIIVVVSAMESVERYVLEETMPSRLFQKARRDSEDDLRDYWCCLAEKQCLFEVRLISSRAPQLNQSRSFSRVCCGNVRPSFRCRALRRWTVFPWRRGRQDSCVAKDRLKPPEDPGQL